MSNENKQTKPDCPLIGEDGNIFHIVGIAAKTLKSNGMSAEASEMTAKVFGSGSYEKALGIATLQELTQQECPILIFSSAGSLVKPFLAVASDGDLPTLEALFSLSLPESSEISDLQLFCLKTSERFLSIIKGKPSGKSSLRFLS